MKTTIIIALLALLCGCNGVEASDIAAAAPDILLVSDSVGVGDGQPGNYGYTPYVQYLVDNVHHSGRCPYHQDATTGDTDNSGSSARVAACIRLWLHGYHHAIIHFNAGLHDIYVPGCEYGRIQHEVELSDYLRNLQEVVDAIRETDNIPVFATTTPIEGEVYCHSNRDVVEYNRNAKELMESQGVAVDDLYAVMYPHQDQYHLPYNIHFTDAGYKFLAGYIAKSLVREGAVY